MRVRTTVEVDHDTFGVVGSLRATKQLARSAEALGLDLAGGISVGWATTDPDTNIASVTTRWVTASSDVAE